MLPLEVIVVGLVKAPSGLGYHHTQFLNFKTWHSLPIFSEWLLKEMVSSAPPPCVKSTRTNNTHPDQVGALSAQEIETNPYICLLRNCERNGWSMAHSNHLSELRPRLGFFVEKPKKRVKQASFAEPNKQPSKGVCCCCARSQCQNQAKLALVEVSFYLFSLSPISMWGWPTRLPLVFKEEQGEGLAGI